MRILIPMAGDGRRFKDAGYKENKAVLPMIYRRTGEECPMVVCSTRDLPGVEEDGGNIAFIARGFQMRQGVDARIRKWYKDASFFSVEGLTEGQACTCLIAKEFIDMDDELLIAACDNGIEYDMDGFNDIKRDSDLVVFTYRHDKRVEEDPDAFGWVRADSSNRITGVSVKRHISDTPWNDHAIVGTFWFRKGRMFVNAAEEMMREDDRVNNEFYVDETVKHVIEAGLCARAFEVRKFLNYGTPQDYEHYLKTLGHFREFVKSEYCMRRRGDGV